MKRKPFRKLTKLNLVVGGLTGLLLLNLGWVIVKNPFNIRFNNRNTAGELKLEDKVKVTRVVDGDTIKVEYNGVEETIRLLGVNTPETVDPRKKVECYGQEASDWLKKLIEGKTVRLEADFTQEDKDKYGRYLRYVYLQDGTLVNEKIIEEGYGFEYTHEIPYKYREEFRQYQYMARSDGKGLWKAGVCETFDAQPTLTSKNRR